VDIGVPTSGMRINRDLGNIQSTIAGGALQTMPSSENEPRHLLEEDFDEEMMTNNLGGIQQRVTNYEYAQMEEEKHLKKFVNQNMPETQIIN
jgi:hypothetical protein